VDYDDSVNLDIKYLFFINMPSIEFSKIIKNSKKFSETIDIMVVGNEIIFRYKTL
jgi:hypothetical protein